MQPSSAVLGDMYLSTALRAFHFVVYDLARPLWLTDLQLEEVGNPCTRLASTASGATVIITPSSMSPAMLTKYRRHHLARALIRKSDCHRASDFHTP
jgi:hypothetical protein